MTSRLTKTLAIVLISACGAPLLGPAAASAQTDGGFTARPLPPLPRKIVTPNQLGSTEQFKSAVMPTSTQPPYADRLPAVQAQSSSEGLQAPPVPPGFEATARIVKFEGKPNQAQAQTETPSTKIAAPSELHSKPTPPAARVAELPNAIFNDRSADTGHYSVSFARPTQTPAQEDELKPELEAASPEIDMPELPKAPDTAKGNSDTDGLEDLESDGEKIDREMENRERNDQRDEEDNDLDQDDDREDDLDDLDLDDEDRPQRQDRKFGVWPKKTMQEVRVDVRDSSGDVPEDESSVLNTSSQRYFGSEGNTEKVFAWAAPNIRYQPLYFEDVALERYGQTKGLVKQPIVSAYKFLRDGALLPFNAKIDNPYSCDSPLGFCRPGSPTTAGCGCARCRR